MKKLLIALLGILAVGGGIGYYLWNKPVESMATRKTELGIPAEQLMAEFLRDETAANAQYAGKIISVSGKVLEAREVEGTLKVSLSAGTTGETILCEFDPNSEHARKAFTAGEQISLKGECAGKDFDNTVMLSRCVEVK